MWVNLPKPMAFLADVVQQMWDLFKAGQSWHSLQAAGRLFLLPSALEAGEKSPTVHLHLKKKKKKK